MISVVGPLLENILPTFTAMLAEKIMYTKMADNAFSVNILSI